MKKTEFMERVLEMGTPCIRRSADPCWDFVNAFWVIEDLDDCRKDFCTPGVRLSRKAYLRGSKVDHDAYYRREEKTEARYARWLTEARAILYAEKVANFLNRA